MKQLVKDNKIMSSQVVQETSQREYLQTLLKFIPVPVLHHLAEKPREERTHLPQCQQFNSAVMVIEIKDFYGFPFMNHGQKDPKTGQVMSESFFIEGLSDLSEQFLDLTSRVLHKYGGDVFQFIGNSVIAIWPRGFVGKFNQDFLDHRDRQDKINEDSDIMISRKAAQCAQEIKMECQRAISHKMVLIGVGFGECGIMHAGGVFGRIEHFLIGKGITSALKALKHATPEQPMVLSPSLWRLVEQFFVWKPLMHNIHLPERTFDFVFGLPVKSSFTTSDLRSLVGERRVREIQAELKNYIPSSYRAYLKLKKDKCGSEHRRITMLIVNVEMTSDLENVQSFTIIQKIVKIIQQHAYRMEGSFNKIVSYDGGFAVICTWGLSPMQHADDAARAVIAALTMKKKLCQFFQVVSGIADFNPPVHMGICTGNILMGIVGAEGLRKEIVLIGEVVERAFLFMQTATKVYGRIFCDQATRAEANNLVDFEYLEHIQFSEKILNYPVFSPVDMMADYEFPPADLKPSQILRQLRIHPNPFKLDFDNRYQHTFSSIFGQTEVIPQILEDIQDYVENSAESVWTLCIKGKQGSGKSLFARCLLMEVMKRQGEQKRRGPTFEYVVTTSNPEIAKRFAGSWIPILRRMLAMICAQTRKTREKHLTAILENSPVCDKLDLIEDIFGLDRNEIDRSHFPPQLLLKDLPHAFVMVKSFPQPIEDALLNFLTDFIADVVDQCLSQQLLFFLVFDNLSLADQATWKLLEQVAGSCSNLIIVACLQSGEAASESYKVSEQARRHYLENQHLIDGELFNVVEVEPLTALDIREIVIQVAPEYQKEMVNEINLSTAIIDAQINRVKTEHTQQVIKRQMVQHHQAYNTFLEVERELVEAVVSKCQGNPLWSLSLLHSLMTNNLAFIHQQLLICQKRLRYCFATNCWNNLQLPPVIQKTLTQTLEAALMGSVLVQKLPSDIILSSTIILKAAAVIGPVFTLRQVQALVVDLDQVEVQLEELELRGILELLFDEAHDKCYRFVQSLMREALLHQQHQTHQRAPCHTKIIGYLQVNTVLNYQTKWDVNVEQTLLLQNLLDEARLFTENQLSYTKRQPLTLKKVNTSIYLKDRHIKASEVSRQYYNESAPAQGGSQKNPQANPQRQKVYEQVFITLHECEFCIFKDRLTYEYNQPAYLTIKLDQITDVEVYRFQPPSTNKQGSVDESAISESGAELTKKKQVLLLVECKSYFRGDEFRDLQKEFVFVVDSRREAEEWMGAIEYLRTKATVKSFVDKFGGAVKLALTDGFAKQTPLPVETPQQRFGESLQREIFEAPHAQNLFQIKLYQRLLTISNSKRIKQRLKDKLLVQNNSLIEQSMVENQMDQSQKLSILSLKEVLYGLYNFMNAHLYTRVVDNSLKASQEEEDGEEGDPEVYPVPLVDNKLGHVDPKLFEIKERIFAPLKEAGIIVDERQGFTQLLDREDDTHTRTFIDQHQSPEKKEEPQTEEDDDIMEEEEYQRLIHKKGNQVRFSNLKEATAAKGERRFTIFNPLDPNNAQQALRFLKMPLRRQATRKLSKAGQAQMPIEGEEISGESNLSQSMIQEEQSGVHIVDEPQDYIFEEYNRVKISKARAFQEGQDVMQMVSMLNDINERQVNIKRRRKNLLENGHGDQDVVHIKEELAPGMQALTPSIGNQQIKQRNVSKGKKAQALSKILEQASKKYKSQTVEETKEKRKKKKKKRAPKPPLMQGGIDGEELIAKIDIEKHVIPETSESEVDQDGPKINASNYHRVQSQHDLKMMSSCRSIGYLQTLHEAERTNNEYRTRRDSSSRNQSVVSRRFSKVYKPTPSMKKLPEWPDQSQIPITSKIHRGSYPDDNFDLNDDTENEESLFSKKSGVKQRELSPIPSDNDGPFKADEVLVIISRNVQCIVQGHQTSIRLEIGDKVTVERDLRDFNLVQCAFKKDERMLSIIVPRDAVQRERECNIVRAESALTNLRPDASHHILQQNPIYPSNFDVSPQHTALQDTFSQNNLGADEDSKIEQPRHQSPIQNSIGDGGAQQRSLLKLKERREKRKKQIGEGQQPSSVISDISLASQEPLRAPTGGEPTLQFSTGEPQPAVQLKAMARKMKKMLRVGFNE